MSGSGSSEPVAHRSARYRVVSIAGVGGMGTVMRAVVEGAAGFTRHVALKRLLPQYSLDENFVRLLVEEARVGSRLDHPHIAQVHELGRDSHGDHFLVMEWVEGTDLHRWVERSAAPVDWRTAVLLATDVLDALDYAHRHTRDDGRPAPVIHRDVSPTNVLLGVHGHAKLTDFGLARAYDRERMTAQGMIKGKLSYMAPELTDGADASPASDLYALAVTLWETLASQRLFSGGRDLDVLLKVRANDIPSLSTLRGDVPAAVVALLNRALAKEPASRPSSAAELRRELLAVLYAEGGPPDRAEIGREAAAASSEGERGPGWVASTQSFESDLEALAPDSEPVAFELQPPSSTCAPFDLVPLIDPGPSPDE